MLLRSLIVMVISCVVAFTAGCDTAPSTAPVVTSSPASPNAALLDEMNASPAWFHAKKTRPIWTKELEADQQIKTLEGLETVKAGHFLCRGEAGDIWPQSKEQLEKRYTATDETTPDGWTKYNPRPDAEGVMAVQVDHAFEVQTSWGQLTGKPGDYLAKNFQDRDTKYPIDVWIVDQKLFAETYEKFVDRQ
jgi:hypothetical protein